MTERPDAQLNAEAERGRRAQALLEDPLLKSAFEAIETAIVERFKSSPIDDDKGRRYLRLELHLLRSLKANLDHHVRTGTLARHEIEGRKRKQKPRRSPHSPA